MFTGNIEALLRLIGTYDKIQIPLYWKIPTITTIPSSE